ncbi:hypothetical protein [Burkholderia gladioli]|uniref:hypothetical protein n=1 Tax=Burkholderia gladioli TaxID=28095 RepID=UPI002FE33D6B
MEAIHGCGVILDVASPFPAGTPKNEDELIVPAREGTLRVPKASQDGGIDLLVFCYWLRKF